VDEMNAFTGEQVRILKKFGAHLKIYPGIYLKNLWKTTHVSARTGGNPADVQARTPILGY